MKRMSGGIEKDLRIKRFDTGVKCAEKQGVQQGVPSRWDGIPENPVPEEEIQGHLELSRQTKSAENCERGGQGQSAVAHGRSDQPIKATDANDDRHPGPGQKRGLQGTRTVPDPVGGVEQGNESEPLQNVQIPRRERQHVEDSTQSC